MEEQNFGTSANSSQKNKHFLGLLAGLGCGTIVGGILALISIYAEQEFMLPIILGLMLVGYVVSRFVPNKSVMGAITGALACALTYLIYIGIMIYNGYWYEDGNSSFWAVLIISTIYGGSMGYKGKKGFEGE